MEKYKIIKPEDFTVAQYAKNTQTSGLQKLKDIGATRYSFLSWFWRCLILLILGIILCSIVIAPLIYYNIL